MTSESERESIGLLDVDLRARGGGGADQTSEPGAVQAYLTISGRSQPTSPVKSKT